MSFPALDTFAADRDVSPVGFRVYMHLQRELLDFREPRAVKVEALRHQLQVSKRKVIESLRWLVARGYLVEHERRGLLRVRVFTLAWAVRSNTGSQSEPVGARGIETKA